MCWLMHCIVIGLLAAHPCAARETLLFRVSRDVLSACVPDIRALDQKHHVFPDILGMITDTLQ